MAKAASSTKSAAMGDRIPQERLDFEESASLLSHEDPNGSNVADGESWNTHSGQKEPRWRSLRMNLGLSQPRSVQSRKRNSFTRTACVFCLFLLAMIGLLSILALLAGYISLRRGETLWWPDWDSSGNPGVALGHYPTDFTRDVLPVPCHSHNDYWRRIPLFDAVHAGCTSVEADVWLLAGELYVGHEESALTPNRTFKSLYVDPLVDILRRQNPTTELTTTSGHGVFDVDSRQPLVLLVDFKTEGTALFPVVEEQLAPLRNAGYLSHFDGTQFVQGVITVVGTGNTPFESVTANQTYRDIFFDAPLDQFSLKSPSVASQRYNNTNSYYASCSLNDSIGWPWGLKYSDTQLEKLRDQIQGAQHAGLKSRYWEFPSWPVGLRNYVWNVLVHEGIDYLNVDDIQSATKGTWGTWG